MSRLSKNSNYMKISKYKLPEKFSYKKNKNLIKSILKVKFKSLVQKQIYIKKEIFFRLFKSKVREKIK